VAERSDVARVAMQLSRDVLVASIQVDLDGDVLARFTTDLLERIHASGARGVILDLTGMHTLDPEEFEALRRVITMAAIMGARSVLVGLRPGIVSSLIDAGAEVDGLLASLDLDDAFRLLGEERAPAPVAEVPATPEQEVEAP
jgi:rsbT antagonist protein RsbS